MARCFAQIHKEGNPITTPQPLDYGPGGKRRARTFSQVIADATRGVDAGMNRFTPSPNGSPMGMQGGNQAPDWRGHYLGKRDFTAVLKDVRAAMKPDARAHKAAPTDSLYVHRPLLNAQELWDWAKAAGIPNLVPPAEMHVTQVYSREPVAIEPLKNTVIAKRNLAPLGDKGAVVLHFESQDLQDRHAEAMAAGASHDFPSYITHVTISYDADGIDLTGIEAPRFPLVFGPEVFAPINDSWAKDKGFRKRADGSFELVVPISKTDEDQCLVFGWAQIIEENGVTVIDSQEDEVTEEDLEKAFYYFAEEGRETDEMHTDDCRGQMVECMVFTKEKQRALGIDLGKVGAWVGFRVDPDVFAKVKDGSYPAFSIGGIGRRVRVGT